MKYHANLTKQGIPCLRVNYITSVSIQQLMDLPYSAFFSKLFISNDSIILRLCMLDNFARVFGSSQLKCPWQSLTLLMYKRYVDDSQARFETVNQSHSCQNILNKQKKAIK